MVTDIFTFLMEKGRILFLIVSIAVLLEGIFYLLFPRKVKRIIEKCPIYLFRILGGLAILFALILLHMYLSILRLLF